MSGFALIANFPLGTYRGHLGDGVPDPFPSPARLHAALVCAAAAHPLHSTEEPVPDVLTGTWLALKWLEEHPPDAIHLPRVAHNRDAGIAYRELGLLERRAKNNEGKEGIASGAKEKGSLIFRRLPRPATESLALDGAVAWIWETEPPTEVRVALEQLCPDVSHLGEAESPVRLRVGEANPTHRRDEAARFFSRGGLDLDVPTPGRTKELDDLENSRRRPPKRDSGFKQNEDEIPIRDERGHVSIVRFRPVQPVRSGELPPPWSGVLMISLDVPIEPAWRVAWAVKAHQALIKLAGPEAPGLLTGAYPPEASRPPNRIAIHVLRQERLANRTLSAPSTLAVLLPTGATASDVEVVHDAVSKLSFLRGPGGRTARRLGAPFVLDAERFWPPLPSGHVRLWLTVPAAVPDTRPLRRRTWTMDDAIAFSVGLLWRDSLTANRQDSSWRSLLVEEAKARGVRATHVRLVTREDPTRFVHRVQPGTVVRPYEAEIDLGRLGSEQGLVAIGQSRHLGGGLLYPIDLPAMAGEEP